MLSGTLISCPNLSIDGQPIAVGLQGGAQRLVRPVFLAEPAYA
ncbi:hypothetical protein CYB_2221 [Synechococcus sp. JA-2-3B'a(2-13)]|nr:hypothetical protein CYB_2221 [Synechococcus sp. JA-2-3B'a(2-13)]